jgi:hypothetical protein
VATGAIAIGTVATLRSTTIIITIRTTISTATSAARDKVIGNTTRSTGEMLLMAIEEQRIDLAATLANSQEAAIVPAVVPELAERVALVVLESPAERVALVVPESPAVPERELQTVPVAELELAIDPAEALALGIVPVAEELVLAPAAELATDQPHGHLAVLARTKSVTTPHRPDLVPLLAGEEDLAAVVAETTREPAAAEAATAWAAAE